MIAVIKPALKKMHLYRLVRFIYFRILEIYAKTLYLFNKPKFTLPDVYQDQSHVSTEYQKKMVVPEHRIGVDKIGFIVDLSCLLPHFEHMWNNLDSDSFDIIYTNGCSDEIRDFATARGYNVFFINNVLNSGVTYKTVVATTSSAGGLYFYTNAAALHILGNTKIRMIYGLGKNAWMFSKDNDVFDYHLVYGAFAKRMTEKFVTKGGNIFSVGYPRYDTAYLSSESDIRNSLDLDAEEKIIAWIPTHSASSVPGFIKLMAELNRSYKVIAKLHPLESELNKNLLEEHEIMVIKEGAFNNALLMKIAEFVFCDYGGSMFGPILLGKNLLLLNSVDNPENYATFGKEKNSRSDSMEFKLREQVINFDKGVSADAVRDILSDKNLWPKQLENLNDIKNDLFEPYFGFSGKVAAACIYNIHIGKPEVVNSKIEEIVNHELSKG